MSVTRIYHTAWIVSGVLFTAGIVLAGELGSVPLFLFSVIGSVVAFVYAMYLSLRVLRQGDPGLLKRGVRGTATVLKAHQTNTVMQAGDFAWQAPFVWKYHLKVTIPGRDPYETDCSICAAGMMVGQEVSVVAAPHNHKRVTIDVGQGKPKGKGDDDGDLATMLGQLSSGSTAFAAEAERSEHDPSTPAAKDAPAADDEKDPIKRLQQLADLHDRGVITDAELAAQKKKLLGEV